MLYVVVQIHMHVTNAIKWPPTSKFSYIFHLQTFLLQIFTKNLLFCPLMVGNLSMGMAGLFVWLAVWDFSTSDKNLVLAQHFMLLHIRIFNSIYGASAYFLNLLWCKILKKLFQWRSRANKFDLYWPYFIALSIVLVYLLWQFKCCH